MTLGGVSVLNFMELDYKILVSDVVGSRGPFPSTPLPSSLAKVRVRQRSTTLRMELTKLAPSRPPTASMDKYRARIARCILYTYLYVVVPIIS